MAATELSPSRTVVTSFTPRLSRPQNEDVSQMNDDYEEGVWVMHTTSFKSGIKWLGCALSNGEICVYDTERLHVSQTIPNAHGKAPITDLTAVSSNVIASSGSDGFIRLFDLRQQGSSLECQMPHSEEALSLSIGYAGALAAVGSNKAKIHFCDVRQGGILGSYVDAHTEEVTRVRFQPDSQDSSATTPLLVSASEDGLACTFDTSQASEEAALKSVLNVQTPLREVGFFGPSYEGLYCLTGSESMSVWHHDSAQRICDFGLDLRSKLSQAAGGFGVDYLVNCHWDTHQNQLSLLAGSSTGDAALYKVDAGALSVLSILRGGHRGCVRSWCPITSKTFITGGEDARLCEWNFHQSVALNGSIKTGGRVLEKGGGPLRRQKKKPSKAPY
mmetsp:Transcript_23565/g.33061  ORF Transcript_23565/g.33061 Transcript_23565/m.33061 type:complete len:388 (-) Transcript_23565:121-1284(-)